MAAIFTQHPAETAAKPPGPYHRHGGHPAQINGDRHGSPQYQDDDGGAARRQHRATTGGFASPDDAQTFDQPSCSASKRWTGAMAPTRRLTEEGDGDPQTAPSGHERCTTAGRNRKAMEAAMRPPTIDPARISRSCRADEGGRRELKRYQALTDARQCAERLGASRLQGWSARGEHHGKRRG
jgi:hypothetical protein